LVVVYCIGVVLTGVLQALRRFLAAALAPIASTTVVIVSYLVFGRLAAGMQDSPEQLSDAALAWLAWGTTAGVAVMSLPLLVPVWRCGVRLRPTLRFAPVVARRAGALALGGVARRCALAPATAVPPRGRPTRRCAGDGRTGHPGRSAAVGDRGGVAVPGRWGGGHHQHLPVDPGGLPAALRGARTAAGHC